MTIIPHSTHQEINETHCIETEHYQLIYSRVHFLLHECLPCLALATPPLAFKNAADAFTKEARVGIWGMAIKTNGVSLTLLHLVTVQQSAFSDTDAD